MTGHAPRRGGVLVVGGGITGLSAAYELAQAGVPVTLVEATEHLGGKLRTERVDGFLVESGPDSFVSYRPAGLQLIRELGLGDEVVRPLEPRVVLIRTGGRFVALPQEMGPVLPTRLAPFIATPLFSPLEKLRMTLDLALPRASLDRDVGVGVYLRRRLGRALVDRLAEPLLGGVYGTPIDELSLLAVVPQLRDADRDHRSLFLASLAAGRRRAGSGHAHARRLGGEARRVGSGGSPFVTLAGGVGQLVEALAALLARSADVELRTGVALARLARGRRGYEAWLSTGEELHPDAVILGVPGPVAAALLEPIVPQAAEAVRAIPHGTTAVVSLGYRIDQFANPPAGHGFLVAAGEPLSIDACTISSAKWPGRAAPGTVLLRAFIGSRSGRSRGMTDAQIVTAAERDLAATLGVRGAPLLVRLARWEGQMPQYTVGHLERVERVMAALDGEPGLILAGAPFRGVGIPDCIAQGRAAGARAIAVLEGRGDPPRPGGTAAGASSRAEDEGAAGLAARVEAATGAIGRTGAALRRR